MSVARVTEIIGTSPKSFDAAIQEGLERANKTLKNVKSLWIQDQSIQLEGKKIKSYTVHMKVTFVLAD